MYHTPVLLNESLNLLEVKPGQNYIDATLGNGGHTIEILRRGGIVFGIDQDPDNLDLASKRISSEGLSHLFHPIHGNFSNLKEIYEKKISVPVSGIIYDLGLSSNQQKSQGRGFSFSDEESLDMRLDQKNNQISAEEIINTYPFEKLFDIFTKYAQEKYARPLIYQIINRRQKQPFKKADDLADVIRNY
jgi:16S rRNA (cytosine1402-N4)-methyltransferase